MLVTLLIPYSFLQSLQFKANFLMCFKKKCFFLDISWFFSTVNTDAKKSLSFSFAVLPSLNTPAISWSFIGPTYSLASFLFVLSEERFITSFNFFNFSSSLYFAFSLLCFCTCCNLPFLLLLAFCYLEILLTCCSFTLAFFQNFSSLS